MSNEAAVYQKFRRHLISQFDVHRIDNIANAGTFDVMLSRHNRTIWVELKKDIKQSLRPSQLKWGMNRQKHGCTEDMWIVCPSYDDDWKIFDFTHVLQARGILSRVEVSMPALTNGAMLVFFKELCDG
jgi:hypothetical protein